MFLLLFLVARFYNYQKVSTMRLNIRLTPIIHCGGMSISNAYEPLVQKTLAQLRKLGIKDTPPPPTIHTSYYGSFRPEERDFFTEIVSRIVRSHSRSIVFEKGGGKPCLEGRTLIIPHSLDIDDGVVVSVQLISPKEFRVSFTLLDEFVTIKGKKWYVYDSELDLYESGIGDISEIKGLENLTNLQLLQLQENGIEEIKGLENLTNLKRLYLLDNSITEIKGLENLTNLEVLNLSSNEIKVIKGLENLTELRVLRLRWNNISKIKGLENLTKLETLCLGDNKIKEIDGLDTLTNLKILYLNDNKIEEMKGLENLINLEELSLHNFSYGGNNIEVIKGLGNLKKLRCLNLDYNRIKTATETEELERLTNLSIHLLGTPLGGGLPSMTVKELWRYFIHSAKNVAALARGEVTLKEIGGWWEYSE